MVYLSGMRLHIFLTLLTRATLGTPASHNIYSIITLWTIYKLKYHMHTEFRFSIVCIYLKIGFVKIFHTSQNKFAVASSWILNWILSVQSSFVLDEHSVICYCRWYFIPTKVSSNVKYVVSVKYIGLKYHISQCMWIWKGLRSQCIVDV